MLRQTRSLIVWGLIWAIVYGIFTTASAGRCPGGVTADDGFLDADGQPTDVVPQCIRLTLQPNGWVFVALVVMVLVALTRVLRRAGDEAAAIRTLSRTRIVIAVTVAACIVISLVWFALIPIGEWDGVHTNYWFPFPFASTTLEITPLNG
jgi:hypothetical protein